MDLTIYRGAKQDVVLTLAPVEDITGWLITATVRDTTASASIVATIAASLNDPTNGQFTITFPSATTLAMADGTYRWDVWRVNSGSEELLMAPSTLTILGSVRNQ